MEPDLRGESVRWSIVGWIAAAIVVVVGGAYAWFWFAGGSGEPSTELTTPTIAGTDTTLGTTASTRSTTETTVGTTTGASSTGPASFVLDSTRSLASFELDEELRGSPQRVVGTTDQVAGQVRLDITDLSTVEFSEIVINARTFQTDSGQRDRAIRGPVILDSASDEFEFITFSVKSVDGLPDEVVPGDTLELTVTGDLTVKGITNEETFDVSATLVDQENIEGSAGAIISRDRYGIGIPNVPSVANVSDEVALILEFVLTAS